MIGINDLLRGSSVEETFDRYLQILNGLDKTGAKIYIQATLECSREQCGGTLSVIHINRNVKT